MQAEPYDHSGDALRLARQALKRLPAMAGDRLLVGLLLDAGRETLPLGPGPWVVALVKLREMGSTAGKPAISGISDIRAKEALIKTA